MPLEQEIMKTDVLVIGGGLAGCMAAIRASELIGPENVLVVEKSNVRRSGNAATGVDHTWSYMPEIHGPMGFTIEQLVEDHVKAMGRFQDQDLICTVASTIADRIKDLERWDFPMRTGGEYNYVQKIHSVPTFLHWAGRDQKVLFAKELAKRGLKVLNRVMVTELIMEGGRVVGALGVGGREVKIFLISAKVVIVTTGGVARLFPGPTSWEFNRGTNPYGTGDGVAMAYRVGAEVTGLEFHYKHTGPKNFAKKGRGTWIGVTEDARGEPIGQVRQVADPKKIDIMVESPVDMIRTYREGRGPILMNCAGVADEDLAYMKWGLLNEGNILLLQYMEEMGIDPRETRIEFTFYEPELRGGLVINTKGETNVRGLYAAGDAVGNIKRGVSPAAYVMGWIAGESAAGLAKEQSLSDLKEASSFIEKKRNLYSKIMERETCASWKEALAAVQDVMDYYAGEIRSETLLKAGLAQLGKIRERAIATLTAKTSHELVHCLEAFSLMDVGESSILSALERRESRSAMRETFRRVDYPETKEEMNKMLILRLEDGKPVYQWREPRQILRRP
jgi:succinate dehydrogenase/fumarate reductase flavoprotein subunit